MQENLKMALQTAKYEPRESLSAEVWQAIIKRNRRIIYLKLGALFALGCASLVGLVPALKALILDFSQSGLYEYISLAFSNGGSVIVYWKDFLSLLAESMPFISIISALTLVFVFFLSIKYAMREIARSRFILSF